MISLNLGLFTQFNMTSIGTIFLTFNGDENFCFHEYQLRLDLNSACRVVSVVDKPEWRSLMGRSRNSRLGQVDWSGKGKCIKVCLKRL